MRLLVVAILLGAVPVDAGTLRLGTPEVVENRYTFPVYLQGDADGVAALNFRLAYDPAVFSPVSASSGSSAARAQKQVSSNVASPGEFVVVMMGFNQNTVPAGEVIQLVMERVSNPETGSSLLQIAEPTMATVDGEEIHSRGLAREVRFGDTKEGDGDQDERADARDEDIPEAAPEMSADAAEEGAPPVSGRRLPFQVADAASPPEGAPEVSPNSSASRDGAAPAADGATEESAAAGLPREGTARGVAAGDGGAAGNPSGAGRGNEPAPDAVAAAPDAANSGVVAGENSAGISEDRDSRSGAKENSGNGVPRYSILWLMVALAPVLAVIAYKVAAR